MDITREIRQTLAYLDILCAFADRYDIGSEGLASVDEMKKAVRHTKVALNRLDIALEALTDVYDNIESHGIMSCHNGRITGTIFSDYLNALTASTILDQMKEDHTLFSQRGLEALLNCLQVGMITSKFGK